MSLSISILVPVYNVESYIEDLLNQLKFLSELESDIEFVFVNDKSSDKSFHLIEQFTERHNIPNVQLIEHKENRGLSATRNTLIKGATGNFVWFLDSDDLISVRNAAGLFKLLRTAEFDCLLFDFCKFKEQTWPKIHLGAFGPELVPQDPMQITEHVTRTLPPNQNLTDRAKFLVPYLRDGLHYSWAMIVRRSLLTDIRFPERMIFEDQAVTPRLMLAAKSVRYEPTPVVLYRERADSLMRERTLKAALDVGRAMFLSMPSFEGANLSGEERRAFGVCLLRSIYWQIGRLERLNEMSNPEAHRALRLSVAQFQQFIGDQERGTIRLMPKHSRKVLSKILSNTSLYLFIRRVEELWHSKIQIKRFSKRARGSLWKIPPRVKPFIQRSLPRSVFQRVEAAWRRLVYKVP